MKARSNVYLLGFIVTLCLVVIDSAAYSNYRTRPRATRGFKNAALSTARGFGKRNSYLGSSDTFFDLPIDFKKTTHEDFLKEFPSDSGR